jgi:hypothetical protein
VANEDPYYYAGADETEPNTGLSFAMQVRKMNDYHDWQNHISDLQEKAMK